MSRTRIWLVLIGLGAGLGALVLFVPGIARAAARNRAALEIKRELGTLDLKGTLPTPCVIIAPSAHQVEPTCDGGDCYLQGVRANLAGDWHTAAELLKTNKDALSLYERGLALWCSGNSTQALTVWMPLKESVSQRFTNIGYLGYVRKQYDVAREWLELADGVSPTARNKSVLGAVFESLGDLPRAFQYDEQAANLAPTNATILAQAAIVALELGEKDKARTYIETAVQISPNNWFNWQIYGDVLRAQQDWAAAEQAYRRVVTLNPTYKHGNAGLAFVLVQEGRIPDARPYVLAAVQYMDSDMEKANELAFYANASSHSGDHATAIEFYTHALTLAPSNAGFFNALLDEYAAAGDCAGMQQEYAQAQKQFTTDRLPPLPACPR